MFVIAGAKAAIYTVLVRVPEQLEEAIQARLRTVRGGELRRAAARLSELYRSNGPAAIRTEDERMAYVAVRMPATYGAVYSALREARERMVDFAPETMLDLGSGPGTALWAASEVFPGVHRITAIERDGEFMKLAQALAGGAGVVGEAKWIGADVRKWNTDGEHDLVVASYSMGELSPADRREAISRAWEAASGAFVMVEPGTKKGFESIIDARRQLLGYGASLAAPCPHSAECPMKAAGDWCHFSVRMERSAEHRRLKGGELGYEDEKFSYLVASRLPVNSVTSRIVRHPLRFSGHTKLQLCAEGGLQEQTVTRSQKELYRKVKKAEWGSGWDLGS